MYKLGSRTFRKICVKTIEAYGVYRSGISAIPNDVITHLSIISMLSRSEVIEILETERADRMAKIISKYGL